LGLAEAKFSDFVRQTEEFLLSKQKDLKILLQLKKKFFIIENEQK